MTASTGEQRQPADHHVTSARAAFDASVDRYVGFVGTELSASTEGAVDRALLQAFVMARRR